MKTHKMPSILEPNFSLLKSYQQQYQSWLSNCTATESTVSSVASSQLWTVKANKSFENYVGVQLENGMLPATLKLPPCDLNQFPYVHSLINDFEQANNFSYENESIPIENVDNFETSRFFIDRPHDMLHPSEINPSFLPIVITHTLTFLIGVIGNCVVITTWSMNGKFRSPTAVFLVSLAIADLLLLLVLVPLETLEYFMITWGGLSSICKTIAYVEVISAMSTVLNLVAVSIERFLVIVYPMRARSWCTMSSTRKGLYIIWGLALFLSTPVLLTKHTSQITYYNATTSLTLYYCFDVENELTFLVAIYQLMVMFVLPALFMVVCYYVVIQQLWLSNRSVNAMTQHQKKQQQQQNQDHNQASTSTSFTTAPTTGLTLHIQQRTTISNSKASLSVCSQVVNVKWSDHFNLMRAWHRWKLRKNQISLQESTIINQPTNVQTESLYIESDLTEKDATEKETRLGNQVKHCRLQWQESHSESGSGTKWGQQTSFYRRWCWWFFCESSPVHTLRSHVNDEISECTMSSSYQMTSFTENSVKYKNDSFCGVLDTNTHLNGPLRTIAASGGGGAGAGGGGGQSETLDKGKIFYIEPNQDSFNVSSLPNREDQLTRYFVDNHDNHCAVKRQYSRTLSNNVLEITRSRIQVIKMLVLIVALFLLCWGPRLIMNVLVKLGLPTYSTWIYNTRVVCNLLSFVHSALNPFVYGFMSSNFRAMVCSSCHRRNRRT